jgi:multiple sugar transport system permease protein
MSPVIWLALTAFKVPADYYSDPPKLIPSHITLDNFKVALGLMIESGGGSRNVILNIRNSIIVAVSTTAISMILGVFAAYGFVGYKFKGRKTLLFLTLIARMIPPIILALPLFLILSKIKIINNPIALIISYAVFNIPFVIWMMKGFIEDIPIELEEAGRIDGLSKVGAFVKIILPLVSPGLAATAIFCMIFSWNEFMFALIMTNTNAAQTIPIAVSGYITDRGIYWGEMSAVATIAILPMLFFVFLVQKHIVRGLTFGAVKE